MGSVGAQPALINAISSLYEMTPVIPKEGKKMLNSLACI